jgi:hypothetical protein
MYVYEEGKDIEAQGSKSKSTNSMATTLDLAHQSSIYDKERH